MNTYNYTCNYTRVYLQIFEWLYIHPNYVICTIIRVFILRYTYNYKSRCFMYTKYNYTYMSTLFILNIITNIILLYKYVY